MGGPRRFGKDSPAVTPEAIRCWPARPVETTSNYAGRGMNSVFKSWASLRCALHGVCHVIYSERNMRVHLVCAVLVLAAGWYFPLQAWEWVALLGCIGMVLAMECVNTAMERLGDQVTQERTPLLRQAKDAAAAGVLLAATTAAVIGLIIFVPHVWERFNT